MSRTKGRKPGAERRHTERANFHDELLGRAPNAAAEGQSMNKLKKRLRDVERLLQGRKDLPADVEVAKQRELQTLQHDLNKALKKRKKSKMIGKYHMLRFHERQKADRRLRQAKRGLENCKNPAQKDSAQLKVHIAQVDFNYALYHPLLVPYSALFAEKLHKTTENLGEEVALFAARQKNVMWLRVEKATESGEAALVALRDEGRAKDEDDNIAEPVPVKANKGKAGNPPGRQQIRAKQLEPNSRTAEADNDDDDASDDNFFE